MRLRTTIALLPALALALSGCAAATTASQPTTAPAAANQPVKASTIEVSEVWSRPALGPDDPQPTASAMEPTKPAMGGGGMADRGPTGAVFLTLRNTGSAPDRLIKAVSAMADVTEIHNVFDNNGVMEMRPVDGVDIPAGGTVLLKPGSFHVMLIGLHKGLALGDQFDVTLEFQQAGKLTVTSTVRQPQ